MGLFQFLFGGEGSSHYRFTGADRAQLTRIEAKLDLILEQMNLEYVPADPPCPLSPEVQELARHPGRKIEAIKLHREQTGAGLKEAKEAVESFIESGR
jgi:hypothetical protein